MFKSVCLIEDKPAINFINDNCSLVVYFGACLVNKEIINEKNAEEFIDDPTLYLDGEFCYYYSDRTMTRLGSDHSGTMPLFFRIHENRVVFSDRLSKIISFSERNFLCKEAVYNYLSYEYVPDPLTLVAGVYKTPPGKYASLNEAGEISFFWLCKRVTEVEEKEFNEDSLKKTIYSAHEKRVTKDNNAIYLSGGIDSCASAQILCDILGSNNLKAYTFSTKNAEQNEYGYALDTANYLGIDLENIVVDPSSDVDLDRLIRYSNAFYPGSIMIDAIGKSIGPGMNLFSCQDTRLHTPSINPLDKILLSSGCNMRYLYSILSAILPASTGIIGKVKKRLKDSKELENYLHTYFFHFHNLSLNGVVNDSLLIELQDYFVSEKPNIRKIYNKVVELAWHRQYSDDIMYMRDSTSLNGGICQLPWYDYNLAIESASIPMDIATRYIKGRSGHTGKIKKVNKFVIRKILEGKLPDSVLFRDKAVCITNHLYVSGSLKPYIDEMFQHPATLETKAGNELGLADIIYSHKDKYLNYGAGDYMRLVELQNLLALDRFCKIYGLN